MGSCRPGGLAESTLGSRRLPSCSQRNAPKGGKRGPPFPHFVGTPTGAGPPQPSFGWAAGRGRGAAPRSAALQADSTLPRARRRSSRAPGSRGWAGRERAGAAWQAGRWGASERSGAGRGAEGAGPRAGGGGGGRGGGGGGEHGGGGERLKCLFFRPGERQSDAIRRALSADGWTAVSSASAPCSLVLLRAEPAPGSSCIPLRRDPLRRRGPESRGGGGALPAREAAEAAEAAAPRSRASAAPASAAQRRRRQIYPY